MCSKLPALLAVLLCTSAASRAFAAASLTPLGEGFANAVSDDGSVVVGRAGVGQAFRWTSGGGMVRLRLVGDSTAYGVSGDGSVVVGSAGEFPSSQAFRWTSAGGMAGLGYLGGSYSYGHDVSGDGSVVVGYASTSTRLEAFRWTSGGGMVGLGGVGGGSLDSFANGISGDGSVIVGSGYSAPGEQAFRWTSGGGMVGLGDLPGGSFISRAYDASADGSVVVGQGFSSSPLAYQAFRWTSAGGMVGLGDLPGGKFESWAYGVSGDGSVVVGVSYSAAGSEAFRWTAAGGMRRLWDVLLAHSVNPAADGWITLIDAQGISADGNTIVGFGNRNGRGEAFVAVIPQPSSISGDYNQNGVVDAADYVVWRKNDGTQQEYSTWRAQFGQTSGSGTAAIENSVPEPSSLSLLTLAAPALMLRRRRHTACAPTAMSLYRIADQIKGAIR
jgi:probable HAF family extracellular repeat protein